MTIEVSGELPDQSLDRLRLLDSQPVPLLPSNLTILRVILVSVWMEDFQLLIMLLSFSYALSSSLSSEIRLSLRLFKSPLDISSDLGEHELV